VEQDIGFFFLPVLGDQILALVVTSCAVRLNRINNQVPLTSRLLTYCEVQPHLLRRTFEKMGFFKDVCSDLVSNVF